MDREILTALESQQRILQEQNKNLSAIRASLGEQNRMLEVLGRIGMRDVLVEVRAVIQDRQMSMLETMQQIESGRSIARWGDGELKLMMQPEFQLMFQQSSPALARDLQNMLFDHDMNSDRLILALPTVFTTRLWMGIWAENWHVMGPLLKASRAKWGNTHVSRPVFFERHGKDAVAAWRRVWDGKRVCIISGRGSRFELIPELFDNVAHVSHIYSEPTNAYAHLETIKADVKDVMPETDVFLIALGPTGSVLAGYLSSEAGGECHAVDIGHLSASYSNVFHKTANPEQLPIVSASRSN
ncbi:GT-D fold domain-containing glycosyltransferase [Arthrobacter zhangbolii]|uniref:GT-D fold domain-containing glycosyltransferase n=1 Tax=Arthrobacter zhangbolii TaxID=2886936 RepID=A0A9X1M4L0_9MICC|nr:GT-D fold domain-containing glycosyltransferase [Arthrobacter zhangbolii]MCC3271146.1 GT-D fold domain-containing protein [Arthrobacter zhangbolii]UON91058.1 GT-D fold domain-containing glycosyltransferase [Arthrobacter zhangbolii]